MRKSMFLLMMPLMLGALAACSDDSEELTSTEESITRVEVNGPDVKFYMDGYDREATFKDDLAYIIFHEADKDAIVAALEQKKGSSLTKLDTLFFNDKEDYPIQLRDYEIPTEGIYQFLDCMRAAVKMNYKELVDIPKVIDAEPYFYYTYPGPVFPDMFGALSCCFRVNSGYGDKLEQTAKEANAIVLGKVSIGHQAFWVVARTKDSVGENAFETMQFFEEAGHRTEPLSHFSGGPGPEWVLYGIDMTYIYED